MQQDKTQNAKVPQDRQKSQQQPVQQKQSVQQQNSKQTNQQNQPAHPMQQNQPKQNTNQPQQRPQQPQQKPQAQQPKPQVQPRPQQAQQPAQPKAQPQARAEDNVVFVGQKPSMAYVLAVMTQFNSGKNEIHVKARGKSISRAVDVAEIVRRKFLSGLRVKSIRIGTEEHTLDDKTTVPVSMIEIVLCK